MITTFYDRPDETLERSRLRERRESKLRRLMEHLPESPFYRAKLDAAGVDPAKIRSLGDLKRLPFTTKTELLESQAGHPPYGELRTYPAERYRYLHQTSGTTAKPLFWLDDEDGWQTWIRSWGHVFRGAGVTADDVVFLAFSFGPYIAHWSSLAGARGIGAMAIPGGGLHSLGRLERLLLHGATVVVSTPTYALHLAEVAAENGLDLAGSGVRITIHAGEPGASIPNVRRRIEEAWGARAFDHAGATEVGAWGFDCREDDGAIHLLETEFIFEIVDPESGDTLPDGTRGELVITTLGRHAMPVVRYKTGDLAVRIAEPCACGRTFHRLEGGVLGRADDMLIVRGVNVYPSAVDNLVRGFAEIVEYEVEIRLVESLHELTVKIEASPESDAASLRRKLGETFRRELNIRVDIVSADPGTLPRYEAKARRFKRIED